VKPHRLERLAEEIREEAARIVASELKDPRIGFVTVTRAELATDLRSVRIFVGVLDPARREEALRGLKVARGYVRRELGRRVRMRFTPEVSFEYDRGLEATERVARLLDEVGSGGPGRGGDEGEG
jgi:ribosome-binding factor A